MVDAEDLRTQTNGTLSFLNVNDLGEHIESQPVCFILQAGVFLIVEDREHQQDGIGPEVAGCVNLDLVNNEILAQYRQVCGQSNGL